MRLAVIVPTYWARPSARGRRPGDVVFDHPTPIDGAETLGRLLQSLRVITDKDYEPAIVVATTAPEMRAPAVERVLSIVESAEPPVPPRLFTSESLGKMAAALGREAGRFEALLDLSGYPQVRNACLLAAHLLGADAAVLIDDDEVFEDPAFLDKVRAGLSRDFEGRPVRALAGYYVNADGYHLLKRDQPAWAAEWPKYRVMDQAFIELIDRPPRYKRTPFAFGGNLTLHRELYTSLPFDTRVTRGEDIDYLMTAAIFGTPTILDNTLSIKHLPPPKSHPAWQQFRQDAVRFAYQRAKMRALAATPRPEMVSVRPEDFDPYPGFFLRDDLDARIERTSRALADAYRSEGDPSAAAEAERTIESAKAAATREPHPIETFLAQRRAWREMLRRLDAARLPNILQ